MPAGLDVGADRIVAATDDGTTGVANAVQAVEDSEYVAEFLDGADALTASGDGERYAIGDAAPDVATMSNEQPSPLLGRDETGRTAELPAAVRADAVEAVLRAIAGEGTGPLCHASTTGADADAIATAAEALGYEAAPVDPALAVCYDALDAPYTGLAVVVDGSTTVATLVVEGVPVSRTELERGGNWIDREVAAASGKDPAAIAELRRASSLEDADAGGLALRYDTLLGNLALALAEDAVAVDEPIPVVVAGAAAPEGIDARLGHALEDANLPFEVAGVDRVDAAADVTARGALVAAEAGGDVVGEPEAPAVAPYAAALADEQAAEASIDRAGADASASSDAAAPGGEPRQLGADGAGPDRQTAAATSSAAESASDDSPEDDLFQFTGEILTELEERLERLEARLGLDDDRPLDDVVADLAADVAEVEALGEELEAVRDDVATLRERTDTVEELDETVTDVDARVADVDAQVSDVGDQVSDVEERVDGVEDKVADVEDDVSDVDGTVADHEGAIADLEDRVETLADSLADVEAELADRADLEPEVESLQADLSDLESEVERVDDDRSDVEEWVQAVDDDLEGVEDEVETVAEDVGTVEDDVTTIESDVATVTDDVAALEDDVGALDDDVAELDDELSTVDEDVDSVRATAETIEERLDELTDEVGEIAGYADRVEALEAELEDAAERSADAETVDALRERLDAIEAAVDDAEAALADDLEDVPEQLAATQERVDDLAESLASATDRLEERVEERIEERTSDAVDAAALSAVEDDLATLERSVSDVQVTLDGVQSDVAELGRDHDETEAAVREELSELRTRVERVPEDAVPEEQFTSSIRRLERQLGELEDSADDETSEVDARAAPVAIAVLCLGLLTVGSLGGGLAYLVGQVAVAGAFVAVPLLVAVLAWFVR